MFTQRSARPSCKRLLVFSLSWSMSLLTRCRTLWLPHWELFRALCIKTLLICSVIILCRSRCVSLPLFLLFWPSIERNFHCRQLPRVGRQAELCDSVSLGSSHDGPTAHVQFRYWSFPNWQIYASWIPMDPLLTLMYFRIPFPNHGVHNEFKARCCEGRLLCHCLWNIRGSDGSHQFARILLATFKSHSVWPTKHQLQV